MNLYPPLFQTSLGTPRDLGSLLGMLSQKFGERPEYYSKYKDAFGKPLKGHNGLDWPCALDTPIFASHDGIVSNQVDENAGVGVTVTNSECKTIYWHFHKYAVDNGTLVKAGDIIGFADSTGDSSGNHLHFGLKLLYNGQVQNRDNGFDGAIDPTPYLVWSYPQSTNLMTKDEVDMLYEILDINDPDGSGRAYWIGKPLGAFLHEFAKNKAVALEALLK